MPVSWTSNRPIRWPSLSSRRRAQGDDARFGKLDGVGGVIEDCLLNPCRVAAQVRGERRDFHLQGESLGLGAFVDDRPDVGHQVFDVHRGVFENEFPGLDLRQVEDVVDDAQQVPGCGIDGVEALGLRRRDAASPLQVGHAEDSVDRRPDLVAHVGQEGTLGNVGGLGSEFGLGQLGGAGGDHFLKMVAVQIEFPFGALARRDIVNDGEQQRLPFTCDRRDMDFDVPDLP